MNQHIPYKYVISRGKDSVEYEFIYKRQKGREHINRCLHVRASLLSSGGERCRRPARAPGAGSSGCRAGAPPCVRAPGCQRSLGTGRGLGAKGKEGPQTPLGRRGLGVHPRLPSGHGEGDIGGKPPPSPPHVPLWFLFITLPSVFFVPLVYI